MNFARKAALTTAAVTALALGMIAAETTLAQEKTVMVGGAAMYPSKNTCRMRSIRRITRHW